jgi:putative colanic acid biosynthesis UDP-glucose lipid carrier transferase
MSFTSSTNRLEPNPDQRPGRIATGAANERYVMSMRVQSQTLAAAADNDLGQGTVRRTWSRQVAVDVVAFLDIAAVISGGLLPASIYAIVGEAATNWILVLQSLLVAAILSYLCLRKWGMYDTMRVHDLPQSPALLFAALGVGLVGVLGIGLPHVVQNAHMWIWYVVWFLASSTLILMGRGLAHPILARLSARGRFDRRVAVFGAGQIARRVHDTLADPRLGITFVGVYDDRINDDRINPEGLVVAGKLDELIEAARAERIDQIVIALPQSADRRMSEVARRLEQLPVSLHVVTHISSDLVDGNEHRVSSMGSVGMIDVKAKPLADWGPFVKRAEDIVIASILVALLAPVMALIAAAIKIESQGPVLYRQRRRGLNQRVIEVLKFRTLTVVEADEDVKQVQPNDPRVTRLGRLLRRTSLDELPQLFNVIAGDMSLVGPRPHAILHDEQYGRELEEYANRHQVKPGITGLAQVQGLRGETSQPEKMKARVAADIAYIKSWSLGRDLAILAQTLWVVVSGRNAH